MHYKPPIQIESLILVNDNFRARRVEQKSMSQFRHVFWMQNILGTSPAYVEEGDIMPSDTNPRGEKRPRDGRGKGVGMKGGRRAGRNPTPCDSEQKRGYGKGKGQRRK